MVSDIEKSATSIMLVCCNERHLQVTPKEHETREASRERASPTSQWHLMKPDAPAERRVEARTCPASSTVCPQLLPASQQQSGGAGATEDFETARSDGHVLQDVPIPARWLWRSETERNEESAVQR